MLSIHQATAIVAAMLLTGAVLLAHPTGAIAADLQLAQTAPPSSGSAAATTAKSAATKPTRADYVETRIKSLHDQLKITPAEETQWGAVAQAMRDNAKGTGALVADRVKKLKTMTAIDDLHSYQAIAKAHLDGLNQLIPAFEALYAAMPDAQKKTADMVFSRRPTRATPPKSG